MENNNGLVQGLVIEDKPYTHSADLDEILKQLDERDFDDSLQPHEM